MADDRWDEGNIPDQSGRVAVVTGANTGIGYETARALAQKGAQVVLAVRDQARGDAAAARISHSGTRGGVEVMLLDLADLASVERFADTYRAKYDRLDLLINNAGVMALPERQESADGHEMQFATNHLGHFALTGRLLDLLMATPGSRVVTVSSNLHKRGTMNFQDLQAEGGYSAMGAYNQSKLANLLFTFELQRRLEAAGADTIAVAAHPGYTATELQRYQLWARITNLFLAQASEMGALPTLRAAVDPDARGGDYYGPAGFMEMRGHPQKTTASDAARDEVDAERLWARSESLTGVRYDALARGEGRRL